MIDLSYCFSYLATIIEVLPFKFFDYGKLCNKAWIKNTRYVFYNTVWCII